MRTPASKMRTPVVKTERPSRGVRAKDPEKKSLSMDLTTTDETDDALVSNPCQQAHSFPMEIDGDDFDRGRRSRSSRLTARLVFCCKVLTY